MVVEVEEEEDEDEEEVDGKGGGKEKRGFKSRRGVSTRQEGEETANNSCERDSLRVRKEGEGERGKERVCGVSLSLSVTCVTQTVLVYALHTSIVNQGPSYRVHQRFLDQEIERDWCNHISPHYQFHCVHIYYFRKERRWRSPSTSLSGLISSFPPPHRRKET